MRERQQLEASLSAFDRIARELDDNVALVALGEEEGDAVIVAEAETALAKLRQEAHTREVEALLSGEADPNDAYVEIHAGAGGTESQDWALMLERMYVRWAEGARLQGRDHRRALRRRGRHQVRHRADQRHQRLWLAQDRVGRASPGAHLAVRFERAPTHELRLGVGLSGDRRHDRDRDRRQGRAHRHLSLLGGRGPARQHHRQRGAHHAHPDQHRRHLSERALAAQEPGDCLGDAPRAAL